jgi:hypothetical protein
MDDLSRLTFHASQGIQVGPVGLGSKMSPWLRYKDDVRHPLPLVPAHRTKPDMI